MTAYAYHNRAGRSADIVFHVGSCIHKPLRLLTIILLLPPLVAPTSTLAATKPRSASSSATLRAQAPAALSPDETQALVKRVLETELAAAKDNSHPMQYRIRKTSPRFATTKEIIETKDGDVARLIAINGAPISAADQQTEDARLSALLNDPGQQRHRKDREQGDAERARKIIRALPDAFLYEYAGTIETPHGPSYRFSFQPNPNFAPQDIEAQALKAMAGELWIDVAQQRVTRLDGKRLHDVDYGWGLVGKLQQGGTLLLEQADVGDHQWRTVHMALVMNARIFIKTVKLDTALELTQFTSVDPAMDYRKAIQILEAYPAQ